MPIPAAVTNVLVRLLNASAQHLGERLGQAFGGKSSKAPFLIEQVKSAPRYWEAQIEYLKRKQARERELLSLYTAKVEGRIALQEQELQDRRELSLLQRELLREWKKLNEIQILWDKDAWFYNLSLPEQQHRFLLLVSPPIISKYSPDY
jgi:hypothetical protein